MLLARDSRNLHPDTHEDADGVVRLDRARGTVLVVGALGHAREDGGHRVDPDLGVGLQELHNL